MNIDGRLNRLLPSAVRYRFALSRHHKGHLAGRFTSIPADMPTTARPMPLQAHFWTPHPWDSAGVHVESVLPYLREQATRLGLPWQITSGPEIPSAPIDWLFCLKAVPPPAACSRERTVLLINDDAHHLWSDLGLFGHVVVVSSPVLASLVGTAHPRVWFVEETVSMHEIGHGQRALETALPSTRPPVLLWHGHQESLDGLFALREILDAFARDTSAELMILTNRPNCEEQWGALRVRYAAWSPAALATAASEARLGIVPARPTLADSYLKSGGRVRRLFALGCPAIGDARSPDAATFCRACDMPIATTPAQWTAALRELWHAPARLDASARFGHALVSDHYTVTRTATQWLWFLAGGADNDA